MKKQYQISEFQFYDGELLHHYVGRMGYDQKFAREEMLIFFIRAKDPPDVPLVTVEYSPTQKRVLQCYGDHDSKPNEDIMTFVNKKMATLCQETNKTISGGLTQRKLCYGKRL